MIKKINRFLNKIMIRKLKNIKQVPRIPSCQYCQYYHQYGTGECHRYPPVVTEKSKFEQWPQLNPFNSCGEFKDNNKNQ